jgi:hypothetical protein
MAATSERIYVARSGAAATTSASVALVAATAKTVLAVLGTSVTTINLKRWRVTFNSVTASDAPALVEVGIISALGTSTSNTPNQKNGSPLAAASSAGYNHSVEPTYVRVIESLYVPVQNGIYDFPDSLGEEALCAISQGFGIRITAPQAQNCHPNLWFAE